MNKKLSRLLLIAGFSAAALFLYKGLAGKKNRAVSQKVVSVSALHTTMRSADAADRNCMVKGIFVKKTMEAGQTVFLLQDDPDSAGMVLPVKCFFNKESEPHLQAIELNSELVLSGQAVYKANELHMKNAAIISQNSPQTAAK